MSIAIVVRCDGTPADHPSIPLGQCRANYPTDQPFIGRALASALDHGWSLDGKRSLCPSCTGAKARQK